jgi:hypothetical protein
MPRRQVVLDLETQKIFDEIGSRNPADLGISVAGVYFYEPSERRISHLGRRKKRIGAGRDSLLPERRDR